MSRLPAAVSSSHLLDWRTLEYSFRRPGSSGFTTICSALNMRFTSIVVVRGCPGGRAASTAHTRFYRLAPSSARVDARAAGLLRASMRRAAVVLSRAARPSGG